MFAHRAAVPDRRPFGVAAVVAAVALAAALAGAAPAAAGPAGPEPSTAETYQVSLESDYLTTDVGGTVTLRPSLHRKRADGTRVLVPRGTAVGSAGVIEYRLPPKAVPVGLDTVPGCRGDDVDKLIVRCTTVSALTFRVDRATDVAFGSARFEPLGPDNTDAAIASLPAPFGVAAPGPREEGETRESRVGRWTVGFALLGAAGLLCLLALALLRRGRTGLMAASVLVAVVCAGPGAWSLARGPLLGDREIVRYPSGPPVLATPETIWDAGSALGERPDDVPRFPVAPDPGHEKVTAVSAYYATAADGGPSDGWLALDGAYGRIDDPRRARNRMLEEAARMPGARVVGERRLILLKGDDLDGGHRPVLFACQTLSVEGRRFAQCAWADSGVRALVTGAERSLFGTAGYARALRDYVQLGNAF